MNSGEMPDEQRLLRVFPQVVDLRKVGGFELSRIFWREECTEQTKNLDQKFKAARQGAQELGRCHSAKTSVGWQSYHRIPSPTGPASVLVLGSPSILRVITNKEINVENKMQTIEYCEYAFGTEQDTFGYNAGITNPHNMETAWTVFEMNACALILVDGSNELGIFRDPAHQQPMATGLSGDGNTYERFMSMETFAAGLGEVAGVLAPLVSGDYHEQFITGNF